MASVWTDKNGNRTVEYKAINGKRPKVRLGKVSAKDAATVAKHIESLAYAVSRGTDIDRKTAEWLESISDAFHQRLQDLGLAPDRVTAADTKLEEFLIEYIEARTAIKQTTRDHLNRAKRDLTDYFGKDRDLSSITKGDTDEFRASLDKKYPSENTVRRICGRCKEFFRRAARKKLIAESPFADMGDTQVRANKAREFFVSRETAAKVIDACPDAQWRLIVALSRFGGLRCPSELVGLRWADVNWERDRITIHSPKTEHHEGHESREIPIFAELRPHLEDAHELAADGEAFLITRYRDAGKNLRTQFNRIVRKAGLKPWDKPFQNMRSTLETELAESYPIHVVCAWIGNSEAVAKEHYLQVTDAHFSAAAGKPSKKRGADSGALQTKSGSIERPTLLSAGRRRDFLGVLGEVYR